MQEEDIANNSLEQDIPQIKDLLSKEAEAFLKQTGVKLVIDQHTLTFWPERLAAVIEELQKKEIPFTRILLNATDPKNPTLTDETTHENILQTNSKSGPSTILLLSACVTDEWHVGTIQQQLIELEQKNFVIICQMLQEYDWENSALGLHSPVSLSCNPEIASPQAGKDLAFEFYRPSLGDMTPSLPIPVISLDNTELDTCIGVFSGKKKTSTSGYVFWFDDIEAEYDHKMQEAELTKQIDPEVLVSEFMKTASSITREFLYILAATCITPDIVTRTQQNFLHTVTQDHFVQISHSRLLHHTIEEDGSMSWDFAPGVRKVLLADSSRSETVKIINSTMNTLAQDFPDKTPSISAIGSLDIARISDVVIDQDTIQLAEVISTMLELLGYDPTDETSFAGALQKKLDTYHNVQAKKNDEKEPQNPYDALVEIAELDIETFTRYVEISERLGAFPDSFLAIYQYLLSIAPPNTEITDYEIEEWISGSFPKTGTFPGKRISWADNEAYDLTCVYKNEQDRNNGAIPAKITLSITAPGRQGRPVEVFDFTIHYQPYSNSSLEKGSFTGRMPNLEHLVMVKTKHGRTTIEGIYKEKEGLFNKDLAQAAARMVKLAASTVLDKIHSIHKTKKLGQNSDV